MFLFHDWMKTKYDDLKTFQWFDVKNYIFCSCSDSEITFLNWINPKCRNRVASIFKSWWFPAEYIWISFAIFSRDLPVLSILCHVWTSSCPCSYWMTVFDIFAWNSTTFKGDSYLSILTNSSSRRMPGFSKAVISKVIYPKYYKH